MPQGLQVFRPDGSLRIDVSDRLGRVLGVIDRAPPSDAEYITVTVGVTGILWAYAIAVHTFGVADAGGAALVEVTQPDTLWINGSSVRVLIIYGVY